MKLQSHLLLALFLMRGLAFAATVPSPTIAGPVTSGSHGQAFGSQSVEGYVETEYAFVKAFNRAADAMERSGYWLKPEADAARKAAAESKIE